MPRSARQIFQGEYYHILSRGNNRQRLFEEEGDFRFFLERLLKYRQKHSVSIFHYCLMPNHIHLLMRSEASEKGITRLMHGLQTAYAAYYQKRHTFTGHVFENRFRSLWIKKESYLLECARYIERNPVRAKLVHQPEDYSWSSFSSYAFGAPNPLITPNPLYLEMDSAERGRRTQYQRYVKQARPYEEVVDEYFEERVLMG